MFSFDTVDFKGGCLSSLVVLKMTRDESSAYLQEEPILGGGSSMDCEILKEVQSEGWLHMQMYLAFTRDTTLFSYASCWAGGNVYCRGKLILERPCKQLNGKYELHPCLSDRRDKCARRSSTA